MSTQQVLRLVADIGGTNARFALARDGVVLWSSVARYPTASFPSLTMAARHYLATQQHTPDTACFAIAGPVENDFAALTNGRWHIERAELTADLGLKHIAVINDFTALALALPQLRADQLTQIGGDAPSGHCRVVLGPGTGFGAAALLDSPAGPLVLPSEAGHAALGASDADELALFDWLLRRGNQRGLVYREQLLSGPGLELLHRGLGRLRGWQDQPRTAADIVAAAEAGDPTGIAVLETFCALLGGAARDIALTVGARAGVYIAGGIVRRFVPLLRQSRFRQRFEASPKMAGWLKPVPVYVITESGSGLAGAAMAPLSRHR